jgi:gluconate 5-dehydrogenase
MNPFSLKGKTALVSGGGTGIGLGIAAAVIEAEGNVILVGRREGKLAEAVEQFGRNARFIVTDVTDRESVARMVERAGPVDILVNNAGIHLKKAAVETELAEFHQVIDTHVYGAFTLTRAFAPGMMERGDGSIIFIASMTSFMGVPLTIAYAAAKSAYLGMVRTLATEFAAKNVRVNGVAPGFIETPMLRQAIEGDAARQTRILQRTPMGKFGEPDDIGRAVVYFSSPAAKFVTGVVMPVDGGVSIGF